MQPVQRVLVMRRGAIGDFILTLPALGALRQILPEAHIEVMGKPRQAILAHHPAYADRIIDLEHFDLYRLFSRRANVSERLAAYLGTFGVVVAYLAAAGGALREHLGVYCGGHVVTWPPRPSEGMHATDHLLQPIRAYRAGAYDAIPRLYLPAEAHEEAGRFWQRMGLPNDGVVALHPGSGGAYKLWPMPGWQRLMTWLAGQAIPCIVFNGPAERQQVAWLLRETPLPSWPCVEDRSLIELAAMLARCKVFVGHDSGLTHLAAAVGTTTLALFGPTDPLTWGPRHPSACVLRPSSLGPLTLETLPPEAVIETVGALWRGSFGFAPSAADCTIRIV
jgi:heptosyltransferase-3